MTADRRVLYASYRGPIEAGPSGPKGAGGLIQVLQPWIEEHGAQWVFAGSDGQGPSADGSWMPLSIGEGPRHQHYDVVSNSILWPLFHGLVERAVGDRHLDDSGLAEGWEGYRQVNAMFADRIARQAAAGTIVVAQDYQLLLVPGMVRALRPDLKVGYFHHIPFARAGEFGRLPRAWREEIVASLAGAEVRPKATTNRRDGPDDRDRHGYPQADPHLRGGACDNRQAGPMSRRSPPRLTADPIPGGIGRGPGD